MPRDLPNVSQRITDRADKIAEVLIKQLVKPTDMTEIETVAFYSHMMAKVLAAMRCHIEPSVPATDLERWLVTYFTVNIPLTPQLNNETAYSSFHHFRDQPFNIVNAELLHEAIQ